MKFTEKDLDLINQALVLHGRHAEQQARDFRREPPSEDIAASYDQVVAQVEALRARIREHEATSRQRLRKLLDQGG